MEQLFTAFGIDSKLLLAQAINFGVLLVALRYFLYKPVLKTLEERKATIAKGVEDAEEASSALAGATEKAQFLVASSETEAESIVASARNEANSEKGRILKEAEAGAQAVAKDAEIRARETAHKSLRESEQEVARLAILAAEKIMRTQS
jgi:F-type H+-transporting ATPase subunit b